MLFIIFGLFFIGVTVLAVKRRAYEDNPYVFAMLVVFAVGLTLSGVSMAFIGSDRLSGFLLGGTMGTVICLLGGINIRAALVCDTPVEALYCGFASYSGGKGVESHAPIFDYRVNDVAYHRQSTQTFSRRLLEKKMIPGETVTVYVEAARPENVILKRRIGVKNILFVLFGLFCYGFGLMVLFQ